jgi:multisubunit Na+/H+ antiporter MnhB subunit
MVKTQRSFFQKRSVVAAIGIIALLSGFVFLNMGAMVNPFTGRVTGNAISSSFFPFSLISIIGMLLLVCAAILIIYALVKRE